MLRLLVVIAPVCLLTQAPWSQVVIGLTILAYRYEGLRREDFDEVLGQALSQFGGVQEA